MPSHTTDLNATLPTITEAVILEAIRSLQFGSVEVTVHDSRVVQVECTRKIRFGSNGALENGSKHLGKVG